MCFINMEPIFNPAGLKQNKKNLNFDKIINYLWS
jgi:hypothetical protein